MKHKLKVIISLVLMLIMSMMLIPTDAANMADAEGQASALKQLGLFKGVSDTSFELDRAPTRTEALVMLIRVLGKETEALNGKWSHPFSDVASWADKYVGYAFERGLTKGISATEFGTGNANSDMYLTFMLRALGYDDSAGDFKWNEPDTLAKTVIYSCEIDTSNFLRADVVLVSWSALEASLKDGSQTLSEKLIGDGVFTSENYYAAKQTGNSLPTTGSESGGKIEPPNASDAIVSTFAELQAAVENKEITVINIGSDIDITGDFLFERNNDNDNDEDDYKLAINIEKGTTFTVSGSFTPVGCSITNDGAMIINGTFNRGLCSFTNNALVTVKNGGTASSGMSDTYNNGAFIVDAGGNLLIERGTQFYNLGTITNNGYISINDGGSLDNKDGSILNNGIIDLYTYFNGDIADITGTGTLNDNRD